MIMRNTAMIKCNPAIKAPENREALWQALLDDRLDVIATDHAPHTGAEKEQPYEKAPAGIPLVHTLCCLCCRTTARPRFAGKDCAENEPRRGRLFPIRERGYIREGYFADLVLVDFGYNKPL
jgi:dihydroorotase